MKDLLVKIGLSALAVFLYGVTLYIGRNVFNMPGDAIVAGFVVMTFARTLYLEWCINNIRNGGRNE